MAYLIMTVTPVSPEEHQALLAYRLQVDPREPLDEMDRHRRITGEQVEVMAVMEVMAAAAVKRFIAAMQ